ncbi:MAG: Fur family transcriptional regulator [Bacteroidia bacterium]
MSFFTEAKTLLEKYLKEKKLRRTQDRLLILRAIYEDLHHFDAESLYLHLKAQRHTISRATVYNTLHLLVACKLVKAYAFDSERITYERSLGVRQHEHYLCMDCGQIKEFCDPRLKALEDSISQVMKMQGVERVFWLRGHCADLDCPYKSCLSVSLPHE